MPKTKRRNSKPTTYFGLQELQSFRTEISVATRECNKVGRIYGAALQEFKPLAARAAIDHALLTQAEERAAEAVRVAFAEVLASLKGKCANWRTARFYETALKSDVDAMLAGEKPVVTPIANYKLDFVPLEQAVRTQAATQNAVALCKRLPELRQKLGAIKEEYEIAERRLQKAKSAFADAKLELKRSAQGSNPEAKLNMDLSWQPEEPEVRYYPGSFFRLLPIPRTHSQDSAYDTGAETANAIEQPIPSVALDPVYLNSLLLDPRHFAKLKYTGQLQALHAELALSNKPLLQAPYLVDTLKLLAAAPRLQGSSDLELKELVTNLAKQVPLMWEAHVQAREEANLALCLQVAEKLKTPEPQEQPSSDGYADFMASLDRDHPHTAPAAVAQRREWREFMDLLEKDAKSGGPSAKPEAASSLVIAQIGQSR